MKWQKMLGWGLRTRTRTLHCCYLMEFGWIVEICWWREDVIFLVGVRMWKFWWSFKYWRARVRMWKCAGVLVGGCPARGQELLTPSSPFQLICINVNPAPKWHNTVWEWNRGKGKYVMPIWRDGEVFWHYSYFPTSKYSTLTCMFVI